MKKLLFVANYFPPMASGGNARQLRFLRYLPESGWQPTVLTCRAKGPVPDPEGVRVVRTLTPSPDPVYEAARSASAAVKRWRAARANGSGGAAAPDGAAAPPPETDPARSADPGRGANPSADDFDADSLVADQKRYARRQDINRWLFVPDQYVGWVAPAVARGVKLVREEGFDVVFSSFPRPSAELVAAGIAARTGLPWLADYRDPWPTHQFRLYKSKLHERAHFRLERWALGHASWATAVNEPIADDLRRRYPRLRDRVTVIPNGFDRDERPEELSLGDGFWLVHTGRLYSRGGQVTELLDALVALPADVKLLFVGVEGPRILAYARAAGVEERVRCEPFVLHERALGFQRAAGALLLIPGAAKESLSSKIYEYLQSGRPIFALTADGTAAADLLEEAGGSYRPAPDRPLAESLAEFVQRARAGEIPPADPAVVERYDGRTLTARLAGLLDTLLDGRRTGTG